MRYVCVPSSTVLLEDLLNEYCLFIFQGDTRGDKGDMTQVQNQNESGGLMSLVGRPASWDGKALSLVDTGPSLFGRPASWAGKARIMGWQISVMVC